MVPVLTLPCPIISGRLADSTKNSKDGDFFKLTEKSHDLQDKSGGLLLA